jgi:hypothetical protein
MRHGPSCRAVRRSSPQSTGDNMTKFSDTQRQAIIAKGRANAARTDDEWIRQDDVVRRPDMHPADDNDNVIITQDDPLAAWARSMPKPEPMRPERGLDTAPIDYERMMDAKIAAERRFMIEVVAEALVEKFAEERKAAKAELSDQVRSLPLELAETQTTLAELRTVLATERSKVLDLPNPLRARMQ